MKDENKTKRQLTEELAELRRRVADLERLEACRQETEKALQESEARYRLLADNVTDLLWTTDMDLRVTYLSPSNSRLLGYTIEEVNARKMEDFLTPASLEVVAKGFAEVMQAEELKEGDVSEPRTLELEMKCRNGSLVWVETSATLLRDKGGKAVGLVGVTRDITKRKRAEELFRTLADSSPIGIYIVQDGRFKFVNPQFQKSTGYTEDELLGMYSLKFATPADRESVREKAVKMLKGERSLPYEYRMINKYGEPRWVLETVASIQYQGRRATLGNYIDISDRKQAEEELKQSFEKLQRIQEETVNVLASVGEKRDPYTAGHQGRVTRLACAIARELGLTDEQTDGIRVAGLLHDIGKIHVPAEILSKPGKISDYEFSIIKTHPEVGYDIVKGIEFPWPVARTILQHHERLSGSGYPAGLSGEEIALEARILSVADVVEAMSSHRPYRSALGVDTALEEISQNSGVLYDPEVVGACVRLFAEKGFAFDQVIEGHSRFGERSGVDPDFEQMKKGR